jgi:hypothetical protein
VQLNLRKMNNIMTHQNTLLTQTKMCPKGFDDEQPLPFILSPLADHEPEDVPSENDLFQLFYYSLYLVTISNSVSLYYHPSVGHIK